MVINVINKLKLSIVRWSNPFQKNGDFRFPPVASCFCCAKPRPSSPTRDGGSCCWTWCNSHGSARFLGDNWKDLAMISSWKTQERRVWNGECFLMKIVKCYKNWDQIFMDPHIFWMIWDGRTRFFMGNIYIYEKHHGNSTKTIPRVTSALTKPVRKTREEPFGTGPLTLDVPSGYD